MEIRKVLDKILAQATGVYSPDELEAALFSGRRLTIKLGADPSRPDLHLGHTVVLRHLAALQLLGHEIVFIIGDFTGMIGDPSGRSKTRPALSFEQTRANGQSYFEQVTRILDPRQTRIEYNSRWLSSLDFGQVLALAGKTTLARILERDDFANRYTKKEPIGLHELLYPLMQGYDSVALGADIEVGGTDQTFNLLMGRDLQRDYGQQPQTVITFPLLPGLDGKEKMSKSLDNYIGISEPAPVMFEKCMKVPDPLLPDYFALTSDVPESEWKPLIEADMVQAHYCYAHAITARYWDAEAADSAQARYRQIAAGGLPQQLPCHTLPREPVGLVALMRACSLAGSNSQARRLIAAGAVRINREPVTDPDLILPGREPLVISRGKSHFVRVFFTD